MPIVILINFLLAIAATISMSIMPLFITEQIGLSVFAFGLIEGGTEFLSNIFKLVSGNIFDRIKNKKNIFVLASGLASISKILLFFPTASLLLVARIFERLSNGLFAAPRDAFVGQVAKNKGIALAFLSCSKTLGCVAGPFLVSGVALAFGGISDNLYKLIILGFTLTLTSVILSFFIQTNSVAIKISKDSFTLSHVLDVVKKISPLLVITLFFFLGRFNDGLIIIYLKKSGLPEWFYLSAIGFFNATMFLVSPLLGLMIDRKKTVIVLFVTIISLLLFNFVFYFISFTPLILGSIGLVLWGVQRVGAGITFTAIIFKNIDPKFYGTAIGIFSFITGIGNFIASSICGHLAGSYFEFVFLFSGINSLIAFFLSVLFIKKIKW